MSKIGKRKICLLLDADLLEALLDISFRTNSSMNQVTSEVIRDGLADWGIKPTKVIRKKESR